MPDPTPTPTPEPTPTPTPDPGSAPPAATPPAAVPDPVAPSFAETLGDEFKGNDAFKDITDAKSLATKYMEQSKAMAYLQASLPKAPESPDKYSQVTVPEGVKIHEDGLKAFDALAHKLNIPDAARGELLSLQYSLIKAQGDAITKQYNESMTAIKKEMGAKFEESFQAANKIVEAVPELKALMGEPDPSGEYAILRTNPNFFKALSMLGQRIQVDRLPNTPNNAKSGQPLGTDGQPRIRYKSMGE